MGTAGRLAEGQPFALAVLGPAGAGDVAARRGARRWPALLVLWAAWAAWQRAARRRARPREALLAERERLLGAIAAIDAEQRARGTADPRAAAKRDRLLAAAEQVYAELDALPGAGTAA